MKFDASTTNEAKRFVSENLPKLGKVTSVEHSRNKNKIDYQTTIHGTDDTMVITGGLTSGYGGEGPNGLATVLKELGVEEEVAEQHAKGNREQSYSFSIDL